MPLLPRLAACILLSLTACVSEVASGRAATGALLRLETRVHTEHGVVREQVGQVQYTSASGQAAGGAAIYANRAVATSRILWRGFQGDQPLSDEDLFRIAGDGDAASNARAYRRRGRIMATGGVAAAVAGAVALGFGIALDQVDLITGGAIGLGIGPAVAYFGYAQLHPDNHAVSYERAEEAVRRHNLRHRRAAIPLVTGSF